MRSFRNRSSCPTLPRKKVFGGQKITSKMSKPDIRLPALSYRFVQVHNFRFCVRGRFGNVM